MSSTETRINPSNVDGMYEVSITTTHSWPRLRKLLRLPLTTTRVYVQDQAKSTVWYELSSMSRAGTFMESYLTSLRTCKDLKRRNSL